MANLRWKGQKVKWCVPYIEWKSKIENGSRRQKEGEGNYMEAGVSHIQFSEHYCISI
jgi:hypothetical protein